MSQSHITKEILARPLPAGGNLRGLRATSASKGSNFLVPDLEAWEIAALAILPAIRCSTISSSVPSSILCFPGVKKRRRRVKRAKINRVELGSMGVRNFSTVADGFQIQVQIAAHSLRKKRRFT